MSRFLLFAFAVTAVLVFFYLFSSVVYFAVAIKGALAPFGLSLILPYEDWLLNYRRTTPSLFVLLGPAYVLFGGLALLVYSRFQRKSSEPMYEPINPKISVALTAYNDAESVFGAVRDFAQQDHVSEVVLVDNNSQDGTFDLAKKAGARVVREEQQGYGYACIRGLKEALANTGSDLVLLAEADDTFRAYDIQKMIPYMAHVDMVIGTRVTQELVSKTCQMDWFLVWGNNFLAKLIELKHWNLRFWSKVRLTDVGCTMRMIRASALERILPQLRVGGMHFSPHMTMVALKNGLKVVEVPITFWERVGPSKGAGGSRLRAIPIGLRMLWEILTY